MKRRFCVKIIPVFMACRKNGGLYILQRKIIKLRGELFMNTKKVEFRKIITSGILCALSLALVSILRFPIIPAAPYLIYEPGDIPIIIASFVLGPIYALGMTAVVSALQALIFNPNDGPFGFFMHVLSTGTLVLTASLIYNKYRSDVGSIIAVLVGTITMTIVMAAANLVLSPIFYGLPREVVMGLLPTAIIPFNLLKAGINSVATIIIYKALMKTPLLKQD
jgi:riboflavin transporter FmnP